MITNFRGYVTLTVIISLIVGAVAGACGSFFLKPYLEQSQWGRAFLNGPTVISETAKINALQEESATIDVVKKVSPSVVSVVVSKELSNLYNFTGPFGFDPFGFGITFPQAPQSNGGNKQKQQVGAGTGFVIDANGLILTNKHVVADTTAEYTVVLSDGTKHDAKVLGRDALNDIAVLKIEAKNLPVVELGDSSKIEIGQTVIAIGNALSEYSNTVTRGVISGINRKIVAGDGMGTSEVLDQAIQTDAAINPGNSGGPLLNLAGQVIGVNTAVNQGGQSVGFAIPINQAKKVIESVKSTGRIIQPWLGVRYVPINDTIAQNNNLKYKYGALIVRGAAAGEVAVVPGSPADKADLAEGDIVLEVNGQKLDGDNTLAKRLGEFKPGDEVTLKVFHKDGEKDVKVKLEERKL